jgi:hypothetical protein
MTAIDATYPLSPVTFLSRSILSYINQPKTSVASESYHVVITTNIRVSIMSIRLGRGGGAEVCVTTRGRSGGRRSVGLLSVSSVYCNSLSVSSVAVKNVLSFRELQTVDRKL